MLLFEVSDALLSPLEVQLSDKTLRKEAQTLKNLCTFTVRAMAVDNGDQ